MADWNRFSYGGGAEMLADPPGVHFAFRHLGTEQCGELAQRQESPARQYANVAGYEVEPAGAFLSSRFAGVRVWPVSGSENSGQRDRLLRAGTGFDGAGNWERHDSDLA